MASTPTLDPQSARALDTLRTFFETPLDVALARHRDADPGAFVARFLRGVAREVPAYADFLARAGVDAASIVSLDAFARVPTTTKDNYARAYPLAALCRGGRLDSCDFLAVSSGSTGEPTAWPRFVSDELGTAWRFEQVFADAFRARERRTLAVVCFALGSWVGGMFTTAACRHLAAKGYPITLVTPGNNRAEILRVVRALGPAFEQVVLLGYPPFLKDVVDAGRADGLDWSRFAVRLVTAGEVFSESWRDLVGARLGRVRPELHTASLYGTADGGVLANETPVSIAVRRFLAARPDAARAVFGEARLPTLCQYDPLHRYFEVDGDQLLFTGDAGAPLVRYRILDRGGVVPFRTMAALVADHGGPTLERLVARAETAHGDVAAPDAMAPPVRDLPFVFVFGRSSFAVSYYGANVYPENVAVGLEQPDVAGHVTGKFVLEVAHGADADPYLHVTVELAAGTAPSDALEAALASSIRAAVERMNSEFLSYAPAERRTPRVALRPLGDPECFPLGVKHRYTRA
jgi:phenylacetate-CoA ligase